MKNIIVTLIILSFGISCEEEPPNTQLADIQKGYWELHIESLKFNETTMTTYDIGGWISGVGKCIKGESEYPYILLDNAFIISADTIEFEIEGDVLTVNWPLGGGSTVPYKYSRTNSVNYPDC